MNLLIADDSEIIRTNLKKLLSHSLHDTRIDESSTVQLTIEKLGALKIDVMVLDIQLPDGTGFDVLDYLNHQLDKPVTIIFTNFPDEVNHAKSIQKGADYFLDKSDEYETLLELLSQLETIKPRREKNQ